MKFSIIVPVYNDPHLPDCQRSLETLQYPKTDYEIVISEDTQQQGSYWARNAGLQKAQGEYLAFLDSDCVADPHWLTALEQSLQHVDAVMGYAKGLNENKIAEYEQTMYEQVVHDFIDNSNNLDRIDTRNFAMKRTVYDTIGGFAESLKYGGDMEYGARMHEAGFIIIFNQKAIVRHHNPTQLSKLLKKRITQNYGNMTILNLHETYFVKRYFKHLLRYQQNLASWLLRWILELTLLVHIPIAQTVCMILPGKTGYWYFKLTNIMAIRLGQLRYIYHNGPKS